MKEPKISVIFSESSPNNLVSDLSSKPADFETAITATGFGKFNLLLILIAIPASWAPIFETTTMSYVFTVAQCDLNLSLDNKGLLNAITYSGMICSAAIWGFLFDTLGRKKLLIIGYFADAVFVLISAVSQNLILLMIAKFLGGFIINGPFAALTSYLSEFHCAKYRPKAQLVIGFMNSFGTVALPLLAWFLLPRNLDYSLFNQLELHSWNLYLFVCGLPALISGTCFIFLPESPKFLMTIGQNEDALKVFRKVYSFNTGNPPETYPIKELVNEIELHAKDKYGGHITAHRTKVQALKEGWQQITPLFHAPYLTKLLLVCTLQTCLVMSINMLRLWLPQIFQAISDYQYQHNGTTSSLCEMIAVLEPAENTNNEECFVNTNNSSVYIESIIVALVAMSGYGIAGALINRLGKKKILVSFAILGGISCISIYFAQNTETTVAMSSLFIAFGSIAANVVLAAIVDLFPTTLRTMTVALAMMMARCGAMVGNIIFPLLLRAGCEPPFFTIGAVIISCGFLALILPNTDNKALD